MRYRSAPPFRQALEARLSAASHGGGPSLARLRKEVEGQGLAAALLDPVLAGTAAGTWDPAARSWRP